MREGTTAADLVRAAFPPGSVTGAPKIQALKVIAGLEGSQREAYTGAIGFASPHAGLQLNVAIRTLEVAGSRAWLGCGGGIVADSDPRAELREALGKAAPIAAALARDRAGRGRPGARRPPRRRGRAAPTPRGGLLETIAVRAGEPVDADAHLARLRASARELYGLEPEVALPAAPPDGRLRVLLAPGGAVAVEAHAEPAAAAEVVLEPRALAGGLGPHKWLDRPQDPEWLAVDLDGAVLEAAWANVWIESADGVAADPAGRRPHPPRHHPRTPAGGPAPARPRGTADAARSRPRQGDLPDLLDPPGDPRRTRPIARAARRRARRAAARRPRNLHENAVVHSLTRTQVHCSGGSQRLTLERMCGHEGRQEAKKDQRFD